MQRQTRYLRGSIATNEGLAGPIHAFYKKTFVLSRREMIKVPPEALELTTPPGALKLIVLPELGAHELKFPRKYEA